MLSTHPLTGDHRATSPPKQCSPAHPPLPLLRSQWPRSSCQIHFGREFPILGETYSLSWLPLPMRRDCPFPKMLQRSQARVVTLFPHSRAQGWGGA